jgi:hypothetical protein
MSDSNNIDQSLYLICIKEKISLQVLDSFEIAVVVTTDQDETVIACSIVDQSALHGLLAKIRDLNLTLISLAKVEIPQKRDPLSTIHRKVDG